MFRSLDPILTERERYHLQNGYGTHFQAASPVVTSVALLGVNGAIEIINGNSLTRCE